MLEFRRMVLATSSTLYAAILLVAVFPGSTEARQRTPLTVAESINTSRFATFEFSIVNDGRETITVPNQILKSPDGSTFAVITLKGNVREDCVEAKVYIGDISGDPRRFRQIGSIRTRALGDGFRKFPVTMPGFFKASWLDDGSAIDILWDENGISQVTRLPLSGGGPRIVTTSAEPVVTFSSSRSRVLYSTLHQDRKEWSQNIENGFVVNTLDAASLFRGRVGSEPWGTYKWFVQSATDKRPTEVLLEGAAAQRYQSLVTSLSPPGRHGIVMATPSRVGIDWSRYDNELVRERVREATSSKAADEPQLLYQLFLIDVAAGLGRPLWDAPGPPLYPPKIAWSPNGRYLLLSPTFLPFAASSAAGRAGLATAIFDVQSDSYFELNIPDVSPSSLHQISWSSDSAILISASVGRIVFTFDGSKAIRKSISISHPAPHERQIKILESASLPPRLAVIDPRRATVTTLLDPNPDLLDRFALGRVKEVEWMDSEGRNWSGRLYLPVSYRSGRLYPLVIQNHGYAPMNRFSLYGPDTHTGLGPGVSIYAAQALAGRDIMVLQIEDKRADKDGTLITGTPSEAKVHVDGFESAIRHLASSKMIDPKRVGIAGWSAGGWYVEYALAQSSFKFAAAIASDNFDSSYFQAVLAGVSGTGVTGSTAKTIGAPGLGKGLSRWLEEAPAFNAHKIRTPLRLQVESGFEMSLYPWEMYNALRNLGKPVEYVAVPRLDAGSHYIQNPKQVLASQEGAVDWFDFWLNRREDSAPGKADQYRRWQKLRQLAAGDGQ